MRGIAASALVALACLPAVAAQQADGCAPAGPLQFICGVGAVEDVAAIPGTRFLLAGAMSFGQPAPLRLIDTRTRVAHDAWPGRTAAAAAETGLYADCPGPPDASRISTTGVALQPLSPGTSLFYAVNEGDRRAIEVFGVAAGGPDDVLPRVTWRGCVPMPEHSNANAVTPLDGRAIAIVSMDDGSTGRMAGHVAGEAAGTVWTWRPGQGLRQVSGLRLRGGNGIASSSDHRWLYVSAWSGAQLWRIAVDGSVAPEQVSLPFLPDNVKRSADGTLLLAAQRPPVSRIANCTGPACPADWLIARIDAATLQPTVLFESPGTRELDYATGVVGHEGRLWITNRGDGRIAILEESTP